MQMNIDKKQINKTYEKYKILVDRYLENLDGEKREKEEERIKKDFLEVKEKFDFPASEYFMYDFPSKTRAEQCLFLPDRAMIEIFPRFNDVNSLDYTTRDKWKVYEHLKEYYHRDICLVTKKEHKDAFFNLLNKKHELFCKPLCGSLGEKTRIVKDTEYVDDKGFNELLKFYKPEGFLAEEMIKQTDFMMRLNPTSVNTLRIMTIRLDDRICMYFEFKIGEMFSIVDNLGWRSLICGVDEKDGTIISAYNKNRRSYTIHPHTKEKVVGVKIPRFFEAIDLAKELARHFPGYRYLSWDLSLTDEGWVIVELNGKGGVCGYQEVYNCGIRNDMERYLTILNKPIELKRVINEGYVPFSSKKECPHAEYPFTI